MARRKTNIELLGKANHACEFGYATLVIEYDTAIDAMSQLESILTKRIVRLEKKLKPFKNIDNKYYEKFLKQMKNFKE